MRRTKSYKVALNVLCTRRNDTYNLTFQALSLIKKKIYCIHRYTLVNYFFGEKQKPKLQNKGIKAFLKSVGHKRITCKQLEMQYGSIKNKIIIYIIMWSPSKDNNPYTFIRILKIFKKCI